MSGVAMTREAGDTRGDYLFRWSAAMPGPAQQTTRDLIHDLIHDLTHNLIHNLIHDEAAIESTNLPY